MNTTTARELGVPVKALNWVRLHCGQARDGRPLLLANMGQDAGGLFVCDIDLETGHCEQHMVGLETARFPTASFLSPTSGVLYVGSAYAGHLHRYDPNLPPGQRHLEDLGPIDPELACFPCRIDEAPDGTIYIGAYNGCSLTRFDPQTGEFTRLGRMDETDMYFYPQCGADGTVAGLVRVCNPHVVVIDPQTGEHRTVGPVIDTDALGKSGLDASAIDLVKGADGLLYLKSPLGNLRLQGMEGIPVDEVPEAQPAATLPDGSSVKLLDGKSFESRTIGIEHPDGSSRSIRLDWEGFGTDIYLVHEGPDGRIYGSSILPEHLFSCDLDGSNMVDHGQCSMSGGEAYSMGNLDGILYIASYPEARISIYDPAKPYRFGEEEGANPRDIGRLDNVAFRPRAMVAGPAGKVWIGSVPDYGMWGGTLAWYDPATGEHNSHRHIVPDCSVTALDWLPELNNILVGTAIAGGSGTQPKAKLAAFVLWDPQRDEAIWTGDLGIENLEGVIDVKACGDGKAYVVVTQLPAQEGGELTGHLMLIDVPNRCVLDRSQFTSDTGWPLEMALRNGPGGAIYGACIPYFYRIVPGTAQRETVWGVPFGDEANYIRVSGPIIGNTYYFATGHRLRAIDF